MTRSAPGPSRSFVSARHLWSVLLLLLLAWGCRTGLRPTPPLTELDVDADGRTDRFQTVDPSGNVVGVVENMQRAETGSVSDLAQAFRAPYLGAIPLDPGVEPALGDADALLRTDAAAAVARIADGL